MLSYTNVGIAGIFVLSAVFLAATLRLGVASSLLISAFRCVFQLWVLSLVLNSVFSSRNFWAVAALSCLFNILAAGEVVFNKSKYSYDGMFLTSLAAIAIPCLSVASLSSYFALSQHPFWEPTQFIPALGMVLGNAMSALGIGLAHVLSQANENRDKIDTLLAYGASRYEACHSLALEALRLSLYPVINQMSVIGMISIPGMMTGALISGSPVDQAAKLQSIIMFTISAATTLTALLSILFSLHVIVDNKHRLRPERIQPSKSLLVRLNNVVRWNKL